MVRARVKTKIFLWTFAENKLSYFGHIYVKTSCEPFRENTRNKHVRASSLQLWVGACEWRIPAVGNQDIEPLSSLANNCGSFSQTAERTQKTSPNHVSAGCCGVLTYGIQCRVTRRTGLFDTHARIFLKHKMVVNMLHNYIYIVWKRNILVHLPYCNKQLHFLFKGCNSFNYFLSLS